MVRESFLTALKRTGVVLSSILLAGVLPYPATAGEPRLVHNPDTPLSSPVRPQDSGVSPGSPGGGEPYQGTDSGVSPPQGAAPTGAEPAAGLDSPVESPVVNQGSGADGAQTTAAPPEPGEGGQGVAEAVSVSAGPEAVPPEELPGVKESKAIVHYTLSTWYFYRWNLQLAEVELEEAIKYWPDFKAAHRDLCLVSLFRGNIGRSIAELMMVVGMGEPIPLNEEEKWDLNKRALQLHYKKGVEQGRKGHWTDAVAEFQWCLVYDKNDPVVHRSLAFAYSSLGEFAHAEAEYERSFQLDPSDAFGRADFAFLLSDKGDAKRALAQLSKAVKMSPAAAALHIDLGWMAEARGDLTVAAQEFRTAAELTPKHAWLWARLGAVLERQAKSDQAIKAYEQAVRLDPELKEARKSLQRLKTQPAKPSQSPNTEAGN